MPWRSYIHCSRRSERLHVNHVFECYGFGKRSSRMLKTRSNGGRWWPEGCWIASQWDTFMARIVVPTWSRSCLPVIPGYSKGFESSVVVGCYSIYSPSRKRTLSNVKGLNTLDKIFCLFRVTQVMMINITSEAMMHVLASMVTCSQVSIRKMFL